MEGYLLFPQLVIFPYIPCETILHRLPQYICSYMSVLPFQISAAKHSWNGFPRLPCYQRINSLPSLMRERPESCPGRTRALFTATAERYGGRLLPDACGYRLLDTKSKRRGQRLTPPSSSFAFPQSSTSTTSASGAFFRTLSMPFRQDALAL